MPGRRRLGRGGVPVLMTRRPWSRPTAASEGHLASLVALRVVSGGRPSEVKAQEVEAFRPCAKTILVLSGCSRSPSRPGSPPRSPRLFGRFAGQRRQVVSERTNVPTGDPGSQA